MNNYYKFLVLTKAYADTKTLTNLKAVTDEVGINHNASTSLLILDWVRKKKNGQYKWYGPKKIKPKHSETIRETTRLFHQ